jgi:malonyl-CoA/methylmalonyl-CoA synthetase
VNLAAAAVERLSSEPTRTAIVGLSSGGSLAGSWRRAWLASAASRWSARFLSTGLAAGDRVALCPPRTAELAAIHLGALAAGLAIVPLSSALTDEELGRTFRAIGAPLVVSSAEFATAHATVAARVGVPWWVMDADSPDPPFRVPPEPGAAGPLLPVARSSDDPALMLCTSGTTGAPKVVALSHGNILANLEALAGLWQRSPNDRLLHMLPAHHFHGLVLGLYGSLLAGNEIVLMTRFDGRGALDAIRDYGVTLVMGVPTMYARMLDAARAEDHLSPLRLALSGSAPLSPELWHRFKDRFGVALVERYGLTETGIVTSNAVEAPRAGSVGKPLPGTRVTLRIDEQYVAHLPGEESPRGEICVEGPTVSCTGVFHTGDLGHFDCDGHLWIDGRIKDLIIVGGSNVIPAEVERALAGVAGVVELLASGLAHPDLGEVVVAYVVVDASAGRTREEIEANLREWAERGLAAYKRPRRYEFLPELPRNAMGKIERARLPS